MLRGGAASGHSARGTIRDENWEYPCGTTRGSVGEIRYGEEDEVELVTVNLNFMDARDALEAALAEDPYTPLREHLACNDDHLIEDLVAMRKAKGLTQDEVAARMNRSKTSVSNFERLGADPHLSTIRRYAAAVGGRITTRLSDFDEELHHDTAAMTVSSHAHENR